MFDYDTLTYLLEQQNFICPLSRRELTIFPNNTSFDGRRYLHKDIAVIRNLFENDEDFFRFWMGFRSFQSRPNWDEYFINLAFNIALRSEDLHFKVGAVIADNKTRHIIGTGYNATLKGSDKQVINLSDRDGRRPWMIHAEENAMFNCKDHPMYSSEGATIYVTAAPCVNCLQRVWNFGIRKVVFFNRTGLYDNQYTRDMKKKIVDMTDLEVVPFEMNF